MSFSSVEKKYCIVPRRDIGYLRFILESYDGLAFFRTLDASQGLIELIWPPSREQDVRQLLTGLEAEVGLREVPPPPPGTYPEI